MLYLRDPMEIYKQSFEIVARETDLSRFPENMKDMIIRLVHAIAVPEIVDDISWSGDAVGEAENTLRSGGYIIVDSNMVSAGINVESLPGGCKIICTLGDQRVEQIAQEISTTRSAAAVELWKPYLRDSVVAIGNAPTALFHLMDMLKNEECPRPSVIIGFPVGFVGATESKVYLSQNNLGIPFVTLHGRRGGSPLAAAAINAISRRCKS